MLPENDTIHTNPHENHQELDVSLRTLLFAFLVPLIAKSDKSKFLRLFTDIFDFGPLVFSSILSVLNIVKESAKLNTAKEAFFFLNVFSVILSGITTIPSSFNKLKDIEEQIIFYEWLLRLGEIKDSDINGWENNSEKRALKQEKEKYLKYFSEHFSKLNSKMDENVPDDKKFKPVEKYQDIENNLNLQKTSILNELKALENKNDPASESRKKYLEKQFVFLMLTPEQKLASLELNQSMHHFKFSMGGLVMTIEGISVLVAVILGAITVNTGMIFLSSLSCLCFSVTAAFHYAKWKMAESRLEGLENELTFLTYEENPSKYMEKCGERDNLKKYITEREKKFDRVATFALLSAGAVALSTCVALSIIAFPAVLAVVGGIIIVGGMAAIGLHYYKNYQSKQNIDVTKEWARTEDNSGNAKKELPTFTERMESAYADLKNTFAPTPKPLATSAPTNS